MRILLLSDTHTSTSFIDCINHENCDICFHAGDSQLIASEFNSLPLLGVCGNCDFGAGFHESINFSTEKYNYLVVHGHNDNVKYDLENLALRAKNEGANIAIYGHTHVVNVEKIDDIILINPGSYVQSRSKYPNTYMVFDEESGIIELKEAITYNVITTFNINELC